ncbi:PEP-CTERM/exosortase system-associated acyltransferase [Halomonas sp. H10-9-1]|uniref:PEP-CTERM/exosortase system-associated acyltransferase n=1 Tax=Halomonas sp. H10-9-1 TaxID=2950871 RepID=UPI0032DEC68B
MSTPSHKENKAISRRDIHEVFLEKYSLKLAATQAEKERVYRLRFDVYCQEIGYQPEVFCQKSLELDAHDRHSIHCYLEHKSSGLAAGCLRLVLPDPYAKTSDQLLPLQGYGGRSLSHPWLHPSVLPETEICEISRFAIARAFRNKPIKNETLDPSSTKYIFSEQDKKTFPWIIISLFLATYSLVGLTGRRHVFAMMEPRLPRLLAMSGFNFKKVGEPIEMHGKRSAYYIDHSRAEEEIHEDLIPMYLCIKDHLAEQILDLPSATVLKAEKV